MQTLTMSFRHVCSCQQASTDEFVLVCLLDAPHPLTGWRDGHSLQPTARAMAKINNTNHVMFHLSPVTWYMLPVTTHLSPMPIATATDPTPANSATLPSKLVHQDGSKNPKKVVKPKKWLKH